MHQHFCWFKRDYVTSVLWVWKLERYHVKNAASSNVGMLFKKFYSAQTPIKFPWSTWQQETLINPRQYGKISCQTAITNTTVKFCPNRVNVFLPFGMFRPSPSLKCTLQYKRTNRQSDIIISPRRGGFGYSGNIECNTLLILYFYCILLYVKSYT